MMGRQDDLREENLLLDMIVEEIPGLTQRQRHNLRKKLVPKDDISMERILDHAQTLLGSRGTKIDWNDLASRHANIVMRNNNTSTTYYVATGRYTTGGLQDWGGFFPDLGIHVEQITPKWFLWCSDTSNRGLSEVQRKENDKGKLEYLFIEVGGERLRFARKKVEPVLHRVPSLHVCRAYAAKRYTPRPFADIAADVVQRLRQLFDFVTPSDAFASLLYLGQTCVSVVLNSFFYVGVDATKGSGKTTLLEILAMLGWHGFLAADISAAGVPRVVDRFAANVLVDELDQRLGRNADGDVVAVLRKGQRRGNKYVRCQPPDYMPVAFDVAGAHGYSFRSEVEDACTDRTLLIHAAQTKDFRLPVLNVFKDRILAPLADELFLWTVHNSLGVWQDYQKRLGAVAGCSDVATCSNKGMRGLSERDELYRGFTQHLLQQEKELLRRLTGRNAELGFVALDVAALLNLDLFGILEPLLEERQRQGGVTQDFYAAELRDLLISLLGEDKARELADGSSAGCKYLPRSDVYKALCLRLQAANIKTVGSRRFTGLLRDLGFVDGVSMTSQRWDNVPKPCLVFTEDMMQHLNLTDAPVSDDELVEFVREEQEQNGQGYPMKWFSDKYGVERMRKLVVEGRLMESPAGTLKVPQ